MRRTMRSSEFHDVDRLWALVAVLLLEGDLGALAQRAVAVTVDAGEVDEEVAPTAVGGDEPEALLVREPLDRSGTHRTLACCLGAAFGAALFDRPVRPVPNRADAIHSAAGN